MAQLYFYYSAMNAGNRRRYCNPHTIIRSGDAYRCLYRRNRRSLWGRKVSSRIGLSSPARLFNPETDLLEDIRAEHAFKPVHCVLVDESQFLTREQVHALSEVVDELDIPVLCYGLRTDFRGNYLPAVSIYWPGRISWLS